MIAAGHGERKPPDDLADHSEADLIMRLRHLRAARIDAADLGPIADRVFELRIEDVEHELAIERELARRNVRETSRQERRAQEAAIVAAAIAWRLADRRDEIESGIESGRAALAAFGELRGVCDEVIGAMNRRDSVPQ